MPYNIFNDHQNIFEVIKQNWTTTPHLMNALYQGGYRCNYFGGRSIQRNMCKLFREQGS